MPAAQRWYTIYGMLVGAWTRHQNSVSGLRIGKLSGPVGSHGVDPAERKALARLGLEPRVSGQAVPRDSIAHWAHCLAEIAMVYAAGATQVWLLAQSGIDEVTEDQPVGQVGSSAMPRKRNPITSENIRGLARLIRAQAEVLQDGVIQFGEHDLAHSSVERVTIPDLCHLSATIAKRFAALVSGLQFDVPDPLPADTHTMLRRLQESGVPYVEAHARLRDKSYRDGKMGADYDPVDPNDEGVAYGTAGW
jgi:adenylosuccinate lyase